MNRILLVGCGNIGSRHLQGLLKFSEPLIIDIVEPNDESKNLAIARLDEISYEKAKHKLFWYRSIDEIKNKSNLTIIATTAVGRVDLINKLLEMNNKRFLVEKIVCQSKTEYDMLLDKMKLYDAKGWVNTPRRYFPSYQKIKGQINNTEVIHLSINAGNKGLGTTAIHLIDLFSWFTEDYGINMDGKYLFDKLFSNKRGDNLIEFAGTIMASASNGSVLSLTFLPYENLPLTIEIFSKNMHLIIDETNEKVFVIRDFNNLNLGFVMQYQSTLTTEIVSDLILNDSCLLPTLEESYLAHVGLFHIFNTHIKKIINEENKLCPIT